MPRSRTIDLSLLRLAVVLAALLAALVATPQRSVAQEPGEDTAPLVSNGTLSPSSLPYLGGTVEISVDVIDDFGVTMVYAEIIGPDSNPRSVQLIQSGENTFSGMLVVGPNFTDEPVGYGVYVQASDTNGAMTTELIGDIQVDAQPQFDEAPIVSNPSVEPRELPAAGGTVTIQADATDSRGITEALAVVQLADGGSASVPLEPISSSRFEGTFAVPANTATTSKQYSIEVFAYDDIGQPGSVDAGTVTVAGRPAASTGRLGIAPKSATFGRVQVGWAVWRWIMVRNTGPKSSAPVEGRVQTSGAPFSLPGGGSDGIHFRLRPGQARTVLVQFRPLAKGPKTGLLTIERTDGAQPGLAIRLSGKGIRRW